MCVQAVCSRDLSSRVHYSAGFCAYPLTFFLLSFFFLSLALHPDPLLFVNTFL